MQADRFYQQFDLQRTAISHDIHIHDQFAESPLPWFINVLIGLGGWIIGLTIVLFAITVLVLFHDGDMDALWPGNMAIGLAFVVLGWSTRFLHLPASVGDGLVFGGMVFAALAAGLFLSGKAYPALLLTGLVLLISARLGMTLALQGAIAILFAGLMAATALQELVLDRQINAVGWIFALQSLAGVVLFMFPSRVDLRPLAGAAMVSAVLSPVLATLVFDWTDPESGMIASRLINFSGLVVLFLLAWVGAEGTRQRFDILVFAALCLPAALILPQAGSSALIVLVLAWCRGSPQLAGIGAALQLLFVVHYFHDPSGSLIYRAPTLIEKSWIIGGVGIVLMALWALFSFREARSEP